MSKLPAVNAAMLTPELAIELARIAKSNGVKSGTGMEAARANSLGDLIFSKTNEVRLMTVGAVATTPNPLIVTSTPPKRYTATMTGRKFLPNGQRCMDYGGYNEIWSTETLPAGREVWCVFSGGHWEPITAAEVTPSVSPSPSASISNPEPSICGNAEGQLMTVVLSGITGAPRDINGTYTLIRDFTGNVFGNNNFEAWKCFNYTGIQVFYSKIAGIEKYQIQCRDMYPCSYDEAGNPPWIFTGLPTRLDTPVTNTKEFGGTAIISCGGEWIPECDPDKDIWLELDGVKSTGFVGWVPEYLPSPGQLKNVGSRHWVKYFDCRTNVWQDTMPATYPIIYCTVFCDSSGNGTYSIDLTADNGPGYYAGLFGCWNDGIATKNYWSLCGQPYEEAPLGYIDWVYADGTARISCVAPSVSVSPSPSPSISPSPSSGYDHCQPAMVDGKIRPTIVCYKGHNYEINFTAGTDYEYFCRDAGITPDEIVFDSVTRLWHIAGEGEFTEAIACGWCTAPTTCTPTGRTHDVDPECVTIAGVGEASFVDYGFNAYYPYAYQWTYTYVKSGIYYHYLTVDDIWIDNNFDPITVECGCGLISPSVSVSPSTPADCVPTAPNEPSAVCYNGYTYAYVDYDGNYFFIDETGEAGTEHPVYVIYDPTVPQWTNGMYVLLTHPVTCGGC